MTAIATPGAIPRAPRDQLHAPRRRATTRSRAVAAIALAAIAAAVGKSPAARILSPTIPEAGELWRLILSLAVLLTAAPAPTLAQSATPLPNPEVVITTNYGSITVRLFRDKAPATVENFLSYVEDGFYAGTIFHRVIPNFMIQGGGFTVDLEEKPTREPVVNESKNRLHNIRGSIAMARTSDPDSATAQFFINQRTNLRLDWQPGAPGYTVFGEVIDGMQVVDFIASSPVQQVGPYANVPVEPVIIEKVERKSLL